jgi:hypothetical protein
MKTMIAIHRTFEGEVGKKTNKIYMTDDGQTVYTAETFPILPPQEVRSTSVNAVDRFLIELVFFHQHKITHCHFHSTDIPKGSTPEDIVRLYWALPADKFREFKPRVEIAVLKGQLDLRNALEQYSGDSLRKIKQLGRNGEDTATAIKSLQETKKTIKLLSPFSGKKLAADTVVAECAKQIPECVIFNQVAGIKDGWIWAASVVALSGGIQRFGSVSSFWHYCGEHVRDGKAVKRVRGKAVDFNPALRTANWAGVESIIKNMNNPWRKFYDQQVLIEKVKKSNLTDVHANNQARRRVRKEILKQFWVACQPISGGKSIQSVKNHPRSSPLSPDYFSGEGKFKADVENHSPDQASLDGKTRYNLGNQDKNPPLPSRKVA